MTVKRKTNQKDDEQFFSTEILELLDFNEESWANSKSSGLKLKSLRPRPEVPTMRLKRSKQVTTPRLRNKARIDLLRYEIKGLEAVLASLQRSKQRPIISEQRQMQSLWRVIALKQKSEKETAEHLNMKLKKMIQEQSKLTVSLCSVLDEWNNIPDPDLKCC